MISIVDDDPSIRDGTTDLIEAMGFVAASFERAEDLLASGVLGRTSCLIADVPMPRMTGLGLLDRLVDSGNAGPTILITAFPDKKTGRGRCGPVW